MLETARSQIAGTVTQTEVKNLPMNGRNFLDLALLIPGVSPTNVGSTQLFAETSAVPGPGLSVGSQRNFSNSFIVDGLSANDDAAGLSGITYGVDARRPVSGRDVRRTGGARTRAGRLHQHRHEERDERVARRLLRLHSRRQLQRGQPAVRARSCRCTSSSTGPASAARCVRDRTFFFANFEQRNLDQSGLTTIAPATRRRRSTRSSRRSAIPARP